MMKTTNPSKRPSSFNVWARYIRIQNTKIMLNQKSKAK